MTWATVVNSFLTLAAVIVAIVFGGCSLRVAEDSVRANSDSLRQNNLATIYAMSAELTKFDQDNPKLAKLFDRELLRPWLTEAEYWKQFDNLPKEKQTPQLRQDYTTLWDEFIKLEPDKQVVVYMASQRIADFTQIAFVQRQIIPSYDWNTWWSYLTDQYDESPFYRAFLAKRPTWYAFLDAIKPDNRGAYFRPPR